MRLTRAAKPSDDPDYIFELKHDGFRASGLCRKWRVQTRCPATATDSGPSRRLQESLGKLPVQNVILDGEVVFLDEHGVSRFNELFSRKRRPVFYAFDLLWLNDSDLRGCR